MPVNTEHPERAKRSAQYRRIRDVVAGEDVVKSRGQEHLARPEGMSTDGYAGYLQRTEFFPATSRTIDGLVGAIFRKPPQVEAPPSFEEQLETFTRWRGPFVPFAKRVVREVIEMGRVGMLIDAPEEDVRDLRSV